MFLQKKTDKINVKSFLQTMEQTNVKQLVQKELEKQTNQNKTEQRDYQIVKNVEMIYEILQ